MNIRNANYKDAPAIKLLLETSGHTPTISLLVDQLELLFGQNDHQVFVYELKKEVVAFISTHYLPQLAYDGGLMVITNMSVDETVKSMGVAKELEEYITGQARIKKCNRIQFHYLDRWGPTHQFYLQQGYKEYPKYFTKMLNDTE